MFSYILLFYIIIMGAGGIICVGGAKKFKFENQLTKVDGGDSIRKKSACRKNS